MIEIVNLEHRYPDGTLALKGINLTIPDGEFLLVAGPNGSGKTTLLRHFNGLLTPAAGSIKVDGQEVRHGLRQVRQWVGMVFQDADSQIVGETVAEDLAFGPENLGLPRTEVAARVASALRAMELEAVADKLCHRLSGGEKRRVAIAGVLAMEPRIILFDEPFANLDYAGVQQTLQQLIRLHHQGHTIVVTTHDLEKVIAHAQRLVILYEGEVKAAADPQSLLHDLPRFGIRPPCYALLGSEVLSWLSP
jgi:biotin transport system ATP-binding protein